MKSYTEEEMNLMDSILMCVYSYYGKQSNYSKNCVLYDFSPFSKDDCYLIHTALMYSCISDRTIYVAGGFWKYVLTRLIMRFKYKDRMKLGRSNLGLNISIKQIEEDISKSGFCANDFYEMQKYVRKGKAYGKD